jgi:prevent-host-death family protein
VDPPRGDRDPQLTAASGRYGTRQCSQRHVLAWRPLKDYIQSYQSLRRAMVRYSTQIRPISYLKANAAEVLQELTDQRQPMVITQNGEAKAVIQDVASYEETQETLALLKILALGNQQVVQGRVKPLADVAKRIRALAVTED